MSNQYEQPRRFAFACYAQQRFEIMAVDCRSVDEEGSHVVWGDGGSTVMRVIKPTRRNGKGGVWFLNEKTGNGLGGPFCYSDYFEEA